MTDEIKRIARAHLAEAGPDLSLRAVARDLGVVSSAVYRYFESRDALLTTLIIDAYNDLGVAAEHAEAAVPRRDLMGRWLALGRSIRTSTHCSTEARYPGTRRRRPRSVQLRGHCLSSPHCCGTA
jgi:AcrR family transcriptional regulator